MFLRASCSQCPYHGECSQKTRMYMNYCGSKREGVEDQIRTAEVECRHRRRFLFRKTYQFAPLPGYSADSLKPTMGS